METGKARVYDISELLRRYPVSSPISECTMIEKSVCMTEVVKNTLILTYSRAERKDKIDLWHPALECALIISIIESYIPITFFSSLSIWKRSAITVPEIYGVLADISWHLGTFKEIHTILHGCIDVLLMSHSSMPDYDNLNADIKEEADVMLCMAINGGNVECLKYAFRSLHLPLSLSDFVGRGDVGESDWRRAMILRGWRSSPGISPSLVVKHISPEVYSLAYPMGKDLGAVRYGSLLREAIEQGSREYLLYLRNVLCDIGQRMIVSVERKLATDEKQIVEECNRCFPLVKGNLTLKIRVGILYAIIMKYADEKMKEFVSGWTSYPSLVIGDQGDKRCKALRTITRAGGHNLVEEVLLFVRIMILDEGRDYGDLFFRKLVRESLREIDLGEERLPIDTYRFLITHDMMSWKMIMALPGENGHHLIDTVVFVNGEEIIEKIYMAVLNKVKKNHTDPQLSIPEEAAPYMFEIFKAMRKYVRGIHSSIYHTFSYPAIYRVLCRIEGKKYENEIYILKTQIEEMYRSECLVLGEDCGHHITCGILERCSGGKVLEEK